MFALKQKHKDEGIEATQLLVKILLNSLYGEQIRKDIEEKIAWKSENRRMTEYDEQVLDYWNISGNKYIVILIEDAGLGDEIK